MNPKKGKLKKKKPLGERERAGKMTNTSGHEGFPGVGTGGGTLKNRVDKVEGPPMVPKKQGGGGDGSSLERGEFEKSILGGGDIRPAKQTPKGEKPLNQI